MQKKYFQTDNGQSFQKQDAELVGEVSALADDRVFAELLRLAPYAGTVAKAVLAHGSKTSGVYGIVAPGALGYIDVRPFRAFIGARTAEGTDALANWQDVRSSISIAEGDATRITSIAVGANATGFARIDLVYAALALENDGPNVPRKLKDPTDGTVTDINVAVVKVTAVTPSVVQGTASATPALPSLPSDSGNVYNIPLAYIRVPAGFSASSALVERRDFHVIAPTVALSPGVGAASLRSADTGFAVDATKLANWANAPSSRPACYVASDVMGEEKLVLVLDLTSGSESHASGASIDASRDWRNRFSTFKGVAGRGALPWLSTTPGLLNASVYNASNNANFDGMGHSFVGASSTDRVVAYVDPLGIAEMTAGGYVKVYADDSTGELRVAYPTGPTHPNCKLVMILSLTGPF